MRRLLFFLALSLSLSGEGSSNSVVITDLTPGNPQIELLKKEIAVNLRASARRSGLEVPLRFVRYRVKDSDNFFTIMARVSQNPDTIASLNGIINPASLRPGQEILIPNARGIFDEGSSSDLAAKYGVPAARVMRVNGRSFLPGSGFQSQEMDYFRGIGFVSPLPVARVTSAYGMRLDPFSHRSTFHGGVDLGAATGTPVFASREGRVIFAGARGGYGNLIIIQHQFQYCTYYGHLSRIGVREGQTVHAGETIGSVGSTGRATGPHLHFEMRRAGRTSRPGFLRDAHET